MADIHHRLTMNAPLDEVFDAVTTEVLARVNELGVHASIMAFDGRRALLRVFDGPTEWIGTEIVIALDTSSTKATATSTTTTIVRLTHRGFDLDTDLIGTNTTRWGRMLLGVKKRVEIPEPTDTMD